MAVSEADTVKDVKNKIQVRNDVPADQQKLMLAGRQLKDEQRVSYYKIKDESNLDLVVLGESCVHSDTYGHTNTRGYRHRHTQTHGDTDTHKHTGTQTHIHGDTHTRTHTLCDDILLSCCVVS